MNFFKVLEKLKSKNTAIILYSLLDRIPIFVFGDKENKVDNFLIELSGILHFRKEFVFYTDFISKREYDYLIQNEDMDYNTQRTHVRCPSNVSLKAINQFNDFKSWVIGIILPKQKENLYYLKNLIRKKIKRFLTIVISSNTISIELEGIDRKLMDVTLERNVLQKISQDTEKSVAGMKRILSEKIKSNKMDKELMKTLLDFEVEKKELKRNILKKEIQNFYSGSKRAFFILSRLNLLNNLEINTKISSKALLKTIDYDQVPLDGVISAPINRILSFINKEWGEDFCNLIENGKKRGVEDKIQSLWG